MISAKKRNRGMGWSGATRGLSFFLWLILALPGLAAPSNDTRVVDAARNKDKQGLRGALQQHADVNTAQADGTTAVAWAAHWDNLEIADLLIGAGANVNSANEYGATPLWLACENGNARMVETLLKAGANPNMALLR